jgi:hypothetical protein
MDQEDWRRFAKNMLGCLKDVERIFSLFSRNLDPTIMGLILDIHEEARALMWHYETWPDRLGIPLTELEPNNRGQSMVTYFEAVYEQAVKDADQLLKTCANLLREIDQRFPYTKAAPIKP